MAERDTRFAGFALLLLEEINNATSYSARAEITGEQEFREKVGLLIARRAYDLVCHTVGYGMEYLDECGKDISGSMGTRVLASIPDMRQWPEG